MKTKNLKLIKHEKNEFCKSYWVSKILNKLTLNGQKEKVENNTYKHILKLKEQKQNSFLILFYALEIIKPIFFLNKTVKRGKTFEIGSPLFGIKQYLISIAWLTKNLKRKGFNFKVNLISEIFSIVFFSKGISLKQKKLSYKKIIKNKAFIHFRWK